MNDLQLSRNVRKRNKNTQHFMTKYSITIVYFMKLALAVGRQLAVMNLQSRKESCISLEQ